MGNPNLGHGGKIGIGRAQSVICALLTLLLMALPFVASCGGGIEIVPTPVSLPAQERIVWSEREVELLEGASERIQQYRKGDATVLVVDAAGVPVCDALVRMEMLKHDFLFGANLFLLGKPFYLCPQAYGDAFADVFNYATLPFYWAGYELIPKLELEVRLKYMARWARDREITTKGHPLVWTSSVPKWAPQSANKLEERLQKRVSRIVEHFHGLVDYWDIVNEPTVAADFNNPVGHWMKACTPAGATALALKWARASNPGATLLVNDWRTDDAYHALLQDVRAHGAQFDAIGIQSHMHEGTWTLDQVWDTCERFKDFGVPLHFTEVTVLSGKLKTDDDWESYHPGWDTTPEGEAIQAEYVAALYTVLFSHPSVQAITWWDLSDWGSWQGAPAGLLRKDMSPKPAYQCLMELIRQEWWSRAACKTDEQGKATVQGFYGQYLLTVERGPQHIQTRIHLKHGQENVFKVQLP